MSTPKKTAIRNILFIVAAASIVAVVAIALHFNRSEKIARHAAAPQTSGPASQDGNAGARADHRLPSIASTSAAPAGAGKHAQRHSHASQSPQFQPPGQDADAEIATLSARQRATFGKIPSARFRDELLQLAPEARALALKIIAAKRIPEADFDCLHPTSGGHLYYACRFLASDPAAGAPAGISGPADTATLAEAAASVPISQPPVRHSRPGATRILFLDFGGGDIVGTAWNTSNDVSRYRALPYDIDGNTATFSDQEQKNIIEIWERVSEYYSAFDVDVTTEKPAVFTRTTGRALITRSTDSTGQNMPAIGGPDGNADGVAILQAFGWLDYETNLSPAFIYYNRLNSNNADIAYATAHELGHNLGLSHDGPGYGTNDDDFGYYSGHGSDAISWAPIMGNGYNFNRRSVNQWSKGEYYSANNTEDDLMIIEGQLGYRGAIAATTRSAALPLTPGADGSLGANGLIRNAAEPHYYDINLSSSGYINFSLYPARVSGTGSIIGSADLKLEILDAAGTVIAGTGADSVTHATLGQSLDAGQWYLRVASGSAGNPYAATIISRTGYTAYGSIGQYTLGTNLVLSNPSLSNALSSELTWANEPGADAAWFGQPTTTHDGIAAAQSGAITQGQSSGVLTTVEGSGTVSFWWKISADAADALIFATTDLSTNLTETPASIAGLQDWTHETLAITTTGTHQFGWTFDKSSAGATGAAWVDQVVWKPDNLTLAISPGMKEADSDAGQFTLAATTSKTWTASTDSAWLSVSPASGNAGNATLTGTHNANDTGSPRRATVTITSGGINRVCEVVQPPHIPLATALDNDLVWTTGGSNIWRGQTITTHDGRHAARSGIILGTSSTNVNIGQHTWLQTTVTGPGVINFWWKVSSEEEESDEKGEAWGDILSFKVNGEERARTSGEKDWTQRSFTITGAGEQTLTWLYQKDPYLDVGGDAAWLDQVTWTSGSNITLNVSPDTRHVAAARGQLPITVDTNIAWTAVSSASWLTISPAGGTNTGTINATHAVNTSTNSRTGTITVRAGNLTDTCIVTQAGGTGTTTGTTSGTNNNNNNNNNNNSGGGGGGGGAPGPWSLLALGLLFVARKIPRRD